MHNSIKRQHLISFKTIDIWKTSLLLQSRVTLKKELQLWHGWQKIENYYFQHMFSQKGSLWSDLRGCNVLWHSPHEWSHSSGRHGSPEGLRAHILACSSVWWWVELSGTWFIYWLFQSPHQSLAVGDGEPFVCPVQLISCSCHWPRNH